MRATVRSAMLQRGARRRDTRHRRACATAQIAGNPAHARRRRSCSCRSYDELVTNLTEYEAAEVLRQAANTGRCPAGLQALALAVLPETLSCPRCGPWAAVVAA